MKRTSTQNAAKEIVTWLDENRMRLHAADCIAHEPSVQCNCGLHRILTYARAIQNDNAHLFIDSTQ